MTPIPVHDPHDERLADYVGLTDGDLVRSRNAFVAEGVLVIRRLLASPYRVRSILLADNRVDALADVLDGVEAPVYVVPRRVMNEVAGFDIHRGALAAADRPPPPSAEDVLGDARLVAVLEGINDTENMGALFRNAAAFGVDAVLLWPGCCDPLYRRAVRVSLGHVLHVPFSTLDNLDILRQAGFTTVALTPSPEAEDIAAFPRPDRTALLLGAEGPGLSPATLAAGDHRVRIPMAAGVDSLNVATAAAVAFHRLTA